MMNDRLPRLVRSGALALLCVSVAGTVLALAAEDEGSDEGGIGRTVPKAVCGAEDNPETGLQGQVPAPLRAAGFQGFNCNLKLIGQSRNDGGNWQTAEFKERRQALGNSEDGDRGDKPLHICGYYGSQSPTLSPKTRDPVTYGVRVVDLTDARKPELTGYLQTSAMLDPWESLKVNERRQLLVRIKAPTAAAGPRWTSTMFLWTAVPRNCWPPSQSAPASTVGHRRRSRRSDTIARLRRTG